MEKGILDLYGIIFVLFLVPWALSTPITRSKPVVANDGQPNIDNPQKKVYTMNLYNQSGSKNIGKRYHDMRGTTVQGCEVDKQVGQSLRCGGCWGQAARR
jgi:hypothetical protein